MLLQYIHVLKCKNNEYIWLHILKAIMIKSKFIQTMRFLPGYPKFCKAKFLLKSTKLVNITLKY